MSLPRILSHRNSLYLHRFFKLIGIHIIVLVRRRKRKLFDNLTHWCRDKMDVISQTTSSSAFFFFNVRISIKISLHSVPKGPINNIPALIQIMAWRRPGDKPLSEAMIVGLLTHICVARPQWVKAYEQRGTRHNQCHYSLCHGPWLCQVMTDHNYG